MSRGGARERAMAPAGDPPYVFKYVIGMLAGVAAVLAVIFVVAASVNDRAEGPALLIEIRVTDTAITPSSIEVEAGRLIEYRLQNDASQQRTLSVASDKVEMLPAESDVLDPHNASVPVPFVNITASSGASSSALVRFTERGEYELRVQTAGRPETLHVATVIVR